MSTPPFGLLVGKPKEDLIGNSLTSVVAALNACRGDSARVVVGHTLQSRWLYCRQTIAGEAAKSSVIRLASGLDRSSGKLPRQNPLQQTLKVSALPRALHRWSWKEK